LQVQRFVRERRPRVVLVEGPADATPLIPLLLDPETAPPVALYAYARDGSDVRAAYWPFCAYSPEYVALRAGREVGADLRFCDLPAAVSLRWSDGEAEGGAPGIEAEVTAEVTAEATPDYNAFARALASAAGFD